MSEAKNTALGSRAGIGYSYATAAKHRHHPPLPAMITVAFILAALVLFTSWDTAGHQE